MNVCLSKDLTVVFAVCRTTGGNAQHAMVDSSMDRSGGVSNSRGVGPGGEDSADAEAVAVPDIALSGSVPSAPPDLVSAPNDTRGRGVPPYDAAWVETRTKKGALKLEKLDTDLKNSKSNSIKESIRRGHDDLGDHYLDCGDLANAMKCYSRARDYCTTGRHVINMCLNVIKVIVYTW